MGIVTRTYVLVKGEKGKSGEFEWQVRRFHTGEVRTFKTPGDAFQPGQQTLVLYLPQAPEWNALYPHP